MKLRLLLVLICVALPLAISGDRTHFNRLDTWTPTYSQSFPYGLGVNIHFTYPQPGEMKMIADAGFRWIRTDFKWDATEPVPGQYDFSAYDRLMSALDRVNNRALLILDYGNPLYDHGAPPRTEATRAAFARWSVAAARHFANRGVIWELYNEPNIKLFWPPKPNVDEYIALAQTVGREFHAAVPNEMLIGPAVSEIDSAFLESCFKAGLLEYWSAVSVHPYRQTDPETAANEYSRLREMIKSYSAALPRGSSREIPIISGEWGFSSASRGIDETAQGRLLTRELLTNIANGIPLSIWYDWKDDGTNPIDPEHHFGLVRNAYMPDRDQVFSPKPAYLAVRTLHQFFDGYSFAKRLEAGSDQDYVLVFTKGDDRRVAAWTSSSTPHRVFLSSFSGPFRIISQTGDLLATISASNQSLALELSTTPVYLIR